MVPEQWSRFTGRIDHIWGRVSGERSTNAQTDSPSRISRRFAAAMIFLVAACAIFVVAANVLYDRNSSAASRPLGLTSTDLATLAPAPTAAASAYTQNATDGSARLAERDMKAPAGAVPATAPEMGASGGAAGQAAPSGQNVAAVAWDRMIVRTANMQLAVKDVSTSVDAVLNIAASNGGRVLSMETHQSGEFTISTLTIQIPSEQFDKVLPALRKLDGQVAKIVTESLSSEDVTDEFTDLQSQLRNLQATESRILALQQKAERLEDILSLDRELRDIRGQIEQIQGRTNFLSKRSALSNVSVSVAPEGYYQNIVPTPIDQKVNTWDPWAVAQRSWDASLDLLSRLASVGIAVAVFLWWLPPVALAAWLISRRSRRRTPLAAPPAPPAGSEV